MRRIAKYRGVAAALIAVFGIFNVGIPVVLATCSMGAMMDGQVCPGCHDPFGAEGMAFSTAETVPCCTSRIIAEKTSSEFLQAKLATITFTTDVVVVPPVALFASLGWLRSLAFVTLAPSPGSEDVPVFNSSLLI
jgi:hypothetical protein